MANRRIGGPLTRIAGALLCSALLSACSTTAAEPAGTSPAPLPAPATGDAPTAAASADAGTDTASTDAPETAPAATGPSSTDAPTVTEPAPEPAPEPPPRWFPAPGTTVRMAGVSARDGTRYVETRAVRAADAEGAFDVDVEIRRIGGEAWAARDTYRAEFRDDEIRVALAPDRVREVPPATRELPLPPEKDARWTTPAGRCAISAVDVKVATFAGERTGCVRVEVVSGTGRKTTRWFDPRLGEVRREVRDRAGKLVAGWALCAETPPDEKTLRKLFDL